MQSSHAQEKLESVWVDDFDAFPHKPSPEAMPELPASLSVPEAEKEAPVAPVGRVTLTLGHRRLRP